MSTDATKPKPDTLVWSLAEVIDRLGISRASLDRWIASGRFPKPDVKLGSKAAWKPGTVLKWIEAGGTAGKGAL